MSEVYLNCHTEEGRSPDVSISAILFILLFPFSTHATCTPTPDCASIGYTETSCETIYLKCPFDQTKLYCFPCDSKYQYTCSNSNEYGDGESCKGKYKSCCNTDCVVGNIYYSDASCSSCLESNKTPVGVVVKDNELIMSLGKFAMYWSTDNSDISSIDETSTNTLDTALLDLSGFSNTSAIVLHYGENANISSTGIAGVYCYNYTPTGMDNTKGQWYLPSAGELYNYVYQNYNLLQTTYSSKLNKNNFKGVYWSSTPYNNYGAWASRIEDGTMYPSGDRKDQNAVSCFLAIN